MFPFLIVELSWKAVSQLGLCVLGYPVPPGVAV